MPVNKSTGCSHTP